MKHKIKILAMATILMTACGTESEKQEATEEFNYHVDRFADIEVLRYQVPGFEELSLQQKKLIYYLSQAAIEGRDILYDQNNKYNLTIRKTLEALFLNYSGDRQNKEFEGIITYLKRVWFSNGIHHHYATDKFEPEFSKAYFEMVVRELPKNCLPLDEFNGDVNKLLSTISPVIFDKSLYAKRVNQQEGIDVIATSANNYYEGVTEKEVDAFYNAMKDTSNPMPISYGLNSKLVKEGGKLVEKVWKVDGMYSEPIKKIVGWLEKAAEVAENDQQRKVIHSLIDYYETGDLLTFDEYSILWVQDLDSRIDFVNGFIETYGDPLGIKASWESVVNFKNIEATKRTEKICANAQWFEDHSPVDPRFKKAECKGVSAKVINAAMLGGDCHPATPIGINLPNANWIRQMHGSKSVTLENITEAYDKASIGNGFNEEFVWSKNEIELIEKYGFQSDNLHTDLHECLGHGSGQMLPGVSQDTLKVYGATIEEARADLFGLYYAADPKMVELGLLPNMDAYKAEYYKYMMNGLMTQLTRIEIGNNIEESHMRNRQLIAQWVYEKGKVDNVIELKQRDGKTFVVINDYEKMRSLIGQLLAEIQRIKSEGDFNGAKQLVEQYGVKVNPALHKEIKTRYDALKLAPYKGFVNPVYHPVTNDKGEIIDIKIDYTESFVKQMIRYSKEFNNL
ncbi:MAG: dipeptidyl peptidase 3 [Paludibacteraceae bacterium]|nr:dipeptidyl peptidase 3 [Paludibacteraceae bacterium]